jgi:exodeoxyribonuclease VII large subunit
LAAAASRSLLLHAQRLDRAALRLGAPAALVAGERQRLLAMQGRLTLSLQRHGPQQRQLLSTQAQRFQRAMAAWRQQQAQLGQAQQHRLQALDPTRVLQRGYAWVEDAQGRAVVSAHRLQPGQQVQAVWADGRAAATIDAVTAARSTQD